jgi:hypothetical protein
MPFGRAEEARAALGKSNAFFAQEFDVYVRKRIALMRPEDYEHVLDGMCKAGRRGGAARAR